LGIEGRLLDELTLSARQAAPNQAHPEASGRA